MNAADRTALALIVAIIVTLAIPCVMFLAGVPIAWETGP